MAESQTFPVLSRRTLEEHEQIHFFLDQLSRSLEKLSSGSVEIESLRRLAAQIDGLRERLVEHFAAEEDGGFFHALVDALPASRNEVERLSQQHPRALDLLDAARVRARHGDIAETVVLRNELGVFLSFLREHERREEDLLGRVLHRERQV